MAGDKCGLDAVCDNILLSCRWQWHVHPPNTAGLPLEGTTNQSLTTVPLEGVAVEGVPRGRGGRGWVKWWCGLVVVSHKDPRWVAVAIVAAKTINITIKIYCLWWQYIQDRSYTHAVSYVLSTPVLVSSNFMLQKINASDHTKWSIPVQSRLALI